MKASGVAENTLDSNTLWVEGYIRRDMSEGQEMENKKVEEGLPPVLQFLHSVSKLKHLERAGWIRHGVKKPESVAGHMYRMAIMSGFVIDDPNIDLNKCIKLSIVHDIGESIIGDITPHDGISNETKQLIENAAIKKLAGMISPEKGDEMTKLFEEYENATSPEGKLVKDLDKFDMILQAYEYEISEVRPKFLQEFFDSTTEYFANPSCHPKVKTLVQMLNDSREKGIPFSLIT